MNLTELKSLMAQSTVCEIDMLKKNNIDCANKMLMYRHSAQLRAYIVGCLLDDYPGQNKALVEFLFEQIKELTLMITLNNC